MFTIGILLSNGNTVKVKYMEDLGKRLKEERERIGLTQAKFAKACGVGRTAQFNYERGEREPSWSYMEAAQKLGVDALYVYSGFRTGNEGAYGRALSATLFTIEMLLGLDEEQLEKLCKWRAEIDSLVNRTGKDADHAPENDIVSFQEWTDAIMGWLATCTKPDRCVDAVLLAKILDAINETAARSGVSLSTEKSVRAALIIYRGAKASGPIDLTMVEETVRLAAK